METIKNAVKTYASMGIIQVRKVKKQENVEITASQETLIELEHNLKNFLGNTKMVSSSDLARISLSGDSLFSNSRL